MTHQPPSGPDRADVADAARATAHAETLNGLGRHDEALRVSSRALAANPHDPDLLLQAAVAEVGLDHPDRARELLLRAGAEDPDSSRVQRVLSFVLLREHQPDAARGAALRAVELAPFDPYAHAQLARAAAACRDRLGAVAAAGRAIDLAPDLAESHIAMADALFPEGVRPPKADLRSAETHLVRALQIEPGNAGALNDIGRIQLALGRQVRAAGHLASAVRADPFAEVVQRNMDVVLLGLVARAHWVLFLMWFIARRFVDSQGEVTVRWVPIVLAVLGVGALAWVVVGLRREVPHHLSAFVRGFVRRQRLGAAWAACLVATTLFFVADAVTPRPWLGVAGAMTLLAGAVLSWVRWFRERRDARRRGLA